MASCNHSHDDDDACLSACIQQFLWTFIYPFVTTLGLLFNFSTVILFHRGTLSFFCCCRPSVPQPSGGGHHDSSTTQFSTSDASEISPPYRRNSSHNNGVVKYRFSGPGYTFIKTMALNSLFFFLTTFPLFIIRCSHEDCGWRPDWRGYLRALASDNIGAFANNVFHWTNVVLVMCYGIQRCCATSGKIKLQKKFTIKTSRYCIALSFQVALFKEMLQSNAREVVLFPPDNGTWIVKPLTSEAMVLSGNLSTVLFEPVLSVAFLLALGCSFTYILLLSTTPLKRRSVVFSNQNSDQQQQQQTTRRPNAERERRMTIVYLAICTTYMFTVIFDLLYGIFSRNPSLSGSNYCDHRIAFAEFFNVSLFIAEMSATLMNILGNRIFRAGFSSLYKRHSSLIKPEQPK